MAGISSNIISNRFNELSIELTNRCPLNCIYCSSNSNLDRNTFLDLQKIIDTIENVKSKFRINTISLSGGETFLYPNFEKLLDYLAQQDLEVIIYTSGIAIDENNKRCSLPENLVTHLSRNKTKLTIVINIQGNDKNLIESINRIPNSFELVEESIDKLLKKKIIIEANIIPMKFNYKFLEEITHFCIKKGFKKIHFLRFVPQGRGDNKDLYLDKNEFREINKKLIAILENEYFKKKINIRIGHPINFLFLLNHQKFDDLDEHHYCRGGLDAPLILPNGDVCMCPAWKTLKNFYAGNIYNQNFIDIWNSNNFKLLRKFMLNEYYKIKNPCKSCKYLKECRGKCVAQRIMNQKCIEHETDLKQLLYSAPDPNCFKNFLGVKK